MKDTPKDTPKWDHDKPEDSGEKYVSIKASLYKELCKDSDFLQALEAAGVDSWEGYENALEDMV